MTNLNTSVSALSGPARLNVGALLAFAALILIQITGGIDYPTIPPGLVISAAVIAIVVLGASWRSTSLLGLVWPAFLAFGMTQAKETEDRLSAPDELFTFVTTLAQALAITVALAAGVAAVVQAFRTTATQNSL